MLNSTVIKYLAHFIVNNYVYHPIGVMYDKLPTIYLVLLLLLRHFIYFFKIVFTFKW